ncbi:MAG: 4Fe-4S ferredoxin [Actinobacteria bacterium RBG_19FT_COMBO_54_7]|uniref:4Fe-4S ferredoxin n=1 Tax=Candidatus Solincola sediminis TaxID=1797199 RepID=A0A1F2WHP3_9ACTN|nr:MAG: 4Fe-4S ferredoxin [Candidatus Solincola sediminis]OFW61702.1 MAG: 4Fe-4S ferredoxin [Candidatus Solincola sediminis]OFW69056.1 MAG: 4Fe-4S ferredoxin [Actinobacteria bacterium RBG_19FT_COMBO_54_7]
MELNRSLQELADALGLDYCGTADLAPAKNFISEQGGRAAAAFPTTISIGVIMPHAIVDQLPNRFDPAVAMSYESHAYNIINQRLNQATSHIAGFLQRAGYAAMPVAAAEHHDDERICAIISHKLTASLAGFGWIGKSCLLITPEVGPRVRWSTVLTDAAFETHYQRKEERCGDCRECVDACPVQAFTGRPFREGEPRESRYDARKCQDYFKQLLREGRRPVCGMCVYACPWGRCLNINILPA